MTQSDTYPVQAVALPEAYRSELQSVHFKHDSVQLDGQAPSIYDPKEIGLKGEADGWRTDVVGEIGVPNGEGVDQDAVIIRMSSEQGTHFMLGGLEAGKRGKKTITGKWVPLQDNTWVHLGRNQDKVADEERDKTQVASKDLWNQEKYSGQVSSNHVSITLFEGNIFLNDGSSNGSTYRGNRINPAPIDSRHGEDHDYGHTYAAKDSAEIKGLLDRAMGRNGEQIDNFTGREVITRDTFPVEGKVDIRSWVAGGEALVVDSKDKTDPEKMNPHYERLLNAAKAELKDLLGGDKYLPTETHVLEAIYNTVVKNMRYDLAYANQVSAEMRSRGTEHRKINLDYYLGEGKGVCRHMALAAAWLGGEFAKQGLLRGRITAEVNQRRADNAAHEWARYTNHKGGVTIIDPAQKYFGKLEDSLRRRNAGKAVWEYFRPGEKAEYQKHIIGQEAVKKTGIVKKLFGKNK